MTGSPLRPNPHAQRPAMDTPKAAFGLRKNWPLGRLRSGVDGMRDNAYKHPTMERPVI